MIVKGIGTSDRNGWVVDGGCDVNGDGRGDLIIGAPRVDINGTDTGAAYVVFGNNTIGSGGVLGLADLNGDNGFVLEGVTSGDQTGISVSCAGDVNSDGMADLIVGARFAAPNGLESGASYVVFGNNTLGAEGIIKLSSLRADSGLVINGVGIGDVSGTSVAAAGDVNSDGVDDVIIGAPGVDLNGGNSGAAYVCFGGSGMGSGGVLELCDLDGSNGFVVKGVAAGDQTGNAVSFVRDINSDGISDLIVGAYLAAVNGANAGASYVIFGNSNIGASGSLELGGLNGSNGFVMHGVTSGAEFGSFVSDAGDIDGDGNVDLIIGAPFSSTNGGSSGATFVVYGNSLIGLDGALDLESLDGYSGFVINGGLQGDNSGVSVSSAGDFNNDGRSDIIIGAYLADPNGSKSGKAYVIFCASQLLSPRPTSVPSGEPSGEPSDQPSGQPSGLPRGQPSAQPSGQPTSRPTARIECGINGVLRLNDLNGVNGFQAIGGVSSARTGCSVSGIGDVNDDGVDDVLVGGYNANSGAGISYVVFGNRSITDSGTFELSSLNGTNGFRIEGIDDGDRSGWSVGGNCDLNGDGVKDFFIGAERAPLSGFYGATYIIYGGSTVGSSGVVDLSGLNGVNGVIVKGIHSSDHSGSSVSCAGDFNNDGIQDLLVGVSQYDPSGTNAAGATCVIYGNQTIGSNGVLELSALDGTNGVAIYGIVAGDNSAWSVSNAGDFNGDGIDDIITGAKWADPNGDKSGTTYIVFGNKTIGSGGVFELSDLDASTGLVINGVGAGDESGTAVSYAGDFNKDGYGDVLLGAPRAAIEGTASGAAYIVFGRASIASNSTLELSWLDGNSGIVLIGEASGDKCGWSVSAAGDVNFDDIPDVIIGASTANVNDAGTAYVVYGGSGVGSGGTITLGSLDGTDGFALHGVSDNDYTGYSVSAAGDVNNDGRGDVIVGKPSLSSNPGAAYIVTCASHLLTPAPSAEPTAFPSGQPSGYPSSQSSAEPSAQPTDCPSGQPSTQPSSQPSSQPTQLPSAQPSTEPSSQPTGEPSIDPSSAPSAEPTAFPSGQPSGSPSSQSSAEPSAQPTDCPSGQPSTQPSSQPSSQPTQLPSAQPSTEPSSQPTDEPSIDPSSAPSAEPTAFPSGQPSGSPSSQSSAEPSAQPTDCPSGQPSTQPSSQPSSQPTQLPSAQPSTEPSSQPTDEPSIDPSSAPSTEPTAFPSGQPSGYPSSQSSAEPSAQPTDCPSGQPSTQPLSQPSSQPTQLPSAQPSTEPSSQPTGEPSIDPSSAPSAEPTAFPSGQPSGSPSSQSSAEPSAQPTDCPSGQPSTQPSSQPSSQPTQLPRAQPSTEPSSQPTGEPSIDPSSAPSTEPTAFPSGQPSGSPSSQSSAEPSAQPTDCPSGQPSTQPSSQPSSQPTQLPSAQPSTEPSSLPTGEPSIDPSSAPSAEPTAFPSGQPSGYPSSQPRAEPSAQPTDCPSGQPSTQPSSQPSSQPTQLPRAQPSTEPSSQPTGEPSIDPSSAPSAEPTAFPSGQPSGYPSAQPSAEPSVQPTNCPSRQPSTQPSSQPSRQPTQLPSAQPSTEPSSQPTSEPSIDPSSAPSAEPTAFPSGQPSGCPSARPSVLPSIEPSAEPSGQRTVCPSGQPTTKPSSRPSKRPVTSSPTSIGATNLPTKIPTVSPTFSPTIPMKDPPKIESCHFSNDGSYIKLVFDVATDRGNFERSHQCEIMLDFPHVGNAMCRWSDDSILRVFPAEFDSFSVPSLVEIGDILRVKDSIVKSKCPSEASLSECSKWPTSSNLECVVSPPVSPSLPSVSISSPSVVSSCNSFTLDISTSTGSGGRPWSYHLINVTSVSRSNRSLAYVSEILAFYQNDYSMFPPTALKAGYLLANEAYIFTVILCNFLQQCNYGMASVDVVKMEAMPMVTISGSNFRRVTRSQTLSLLSSANIAFCNSSKRVWGLSPKWQVLESGVINNQLTSTSRSPFRFLLSGSLLSIAHVYIVTVVVTDTLYGESSSASVGMEIIPSGIRAIISGGVDKLWHVGDGPITVDGSGSYDPDDVTSLAFYWSCDESISHVYLPPSFCSDLFPPEASQQQLFLNTSFMDFNEVIGSSFLVQLRTEGSHNRSDVTFVTYTIFQSTSPKITFLSDPPRKLNALQQVELLSSVEVRSTDMECSWSVNDHTIDLAAISLTPSLSVRFTKLGSYVFNLVIQSSTLDPGSTYVFELSVTNVQSGITATSVSVSVEIVEAPRSGKMEVFPLIGVEVLDFFQFSTSQWTNNELPLTYSFGYYSQVEAEHNSMLELKGRSEFMFLFDQILPGGIEALNYSLICGVYAFNALDARSQATQNVQVTKAQSTTEEFTASILSQLTEATLSQDIGAVNSVVSVGMSVLNGANCSLAPACESLGRHDCSQTAHTCGKCLAGLLGQNEDDDNSPCYTASSAVASETSLGGSCNDISDCMAMQICNNSQCIYSMKSCPSDCSGHGRCRFIVKSSSELADDCLVNDFTCAATCSCDSGYQGKGCSETQSNMVSKQEARYLLILALNDTLQYEDITLESVSGLSLRVKEAGSNPSELLDLSCDVLHFIISDILIRAVKVKAAPSIMADLYVVLDNCNDVYVAASAGDTTLGLAVDSLASVDKIKKVRENLNVYTSEFMIAGEKNKAFVNSYSRSTLSKNVAGLETVQSVPMSLLESYFSNPKSTAHFNGVDIVDDNSATRTIILEENVGSLNYNGSQYTSNSLKVQQHFSTSGSSDFAGLRISKVLITMQNELPQEYITSNSTVNSTQFITHCSDENVTHTFNYTCPGGEVVSHLCSRAAEVITSTCPSPRYLPVCLILSSNDDSRFSNCTVVSFTSTNVTCNCTMVLDQSSITGEGNDVRKHLFGRRTAQSSGYVEIATMSQYTFEGFVSTNREVADLSGSDILKGLTVIVMFSVFWGCGLVGLLELVRMNLCDCRRKVSPRERKRKSTASTDNIPLQTKKEYLLR